MVIRFWTHSWSSNTAKLESTDLKPLLQACCSLFPELVWRWTTQAYIWLWSKVVLWCQGIIKSILEPATYKKKANTLTLLNALDKGVWNNSIRLGELKVRGWRHFKLQYVILIGPTHALQQIYIFRKLPKLRTSDTFHCELRSLHATRTHIHILIKC